MLYGCYDMAEKNHDFTAAIAKIEARYQEIIDGLGLDLDLTPEFNKIIDNFKCVPQQELGVYVKIINFSLLRCNENQKQVLIGKLKNYTSENSIYGKASKRIILGK